MAIPDRDNPREGITEALNRVYGQESSELDPGWARLQSASLSAVLPREVAAWTQSPAASRARGERDPAQAQALRATEADVPALVGLMREFYAEASFPLPEAAAARTFAALIGDPHLGQVWLMTVGGEPAGFVVLTVCFSMEYGGLRGFVDDFFVAPAFRRQGLGAAALAAVRAECEARGVRAVLVETSEDNEKALSVYRRAGFADSGHLLMTLPLAAPVHESPE